MLSSADTDRDSEASSIVDNLFHEWVFRFAALKSGWANEFFDDFSLLGPGSLLEDWLVSCPQQFVEHAD